MSGQHYAPSRFSPWKTHLIWGHDDRKCR